MAKSGYRMRFNATMRGLLNYITYLSSIPGGLGDDQGGLPAPQLNKTFHFDNAILS